MTPSLRIMLAAFALFYVQALAADAPTAIATPHSLNIDGFSIRISDKPESDVSWAQALHPRSLNHYSLVSEATRIRYELTVARYTDRDSATKAFEALVLSTQWSARPISLDGWPQAAMRHGDIAGQRDLVVVDLIGWRDEAERKTLMKKLSDALTQ